MVSGQRHGNLAHTSTRAVLEGVLRHRPALPDATCRAQERLQEEYKYRNTDPSKQIWSSSKPRYRPNQSFR
eukprot:5867896-Pyramimonas_sp.AAC.1